MSSENSAEEQSILLEVEQSEGVLDGLHRALDGVGEEIEKLVELGPKYDALSRVCKSLEELEGLGAGGMFWIKQDAANDPYGNIEYAREQLNEYFDQVNDAEERRESLRAQIGDQNFELDSLHYRLRDAQERDEALGRVDGQVGPELEQVTVTCDEHGLSR